MPMPQKRPYGVDWEPYREEILDLYVTKNNTADATVKHLQEQHAFHVTERQFKYEFGGYKNISALDWKTTILPAISERKHDGKDSDVYFRGDRVCPKRVRKAQRRHSTTLSHGTSAADSSKPEKSSLEDRICIRTPSPHPASPSAPNEVAIDSLITGTTAAATSFVIQQAPRLDLTLLSPRLATHDTIYQRANVHSDEYPNLPLDSLAPANEHDTSAYGSNSLGDQPPLLSTQECPNTRLGPPHTPFDVPNRWCDFIRSHLVSSLPWCQLLDVTSASCGSSDQRGPGAASLSGTTESSFTGDNKCPLSDAICIIGNFMGLPEKCRTDSMPTVARRLQELLPPYRLAGNISLAETFIDASPEIPINRIFEISAFMISNNKLTNDQVDAFLTWVTERHHENTMMRFLSLGTKTTKAFAAKLVESAARLQEQNLLKRFSDAGVSLDHAATALMTINDSDFRSLVISKLAPQSLSGSKGAGLLTIVAATGDLLHARKLIEAGATVNCYVTPAWAGETTPLVEAVSSGDLDVVRLMVESAASINATVRMPWSEAANALTEAVRLGHTLIAEYLLNNGAIIEDHVQDTCECCICYAEQNWPGVYQMLKARGLSKGPDVYEILSAASNREVFAEFISRNPISLKTAMNALQMAMDKDNINAAINLIQQGTLRGSSQALKLLVGYRGESFHKIELLLKLMIKSGADSNIDGILDSLLKYQQWEDDEIDVVIGILINAGLDLRKHGPAAVELAWEWENEHAALSLLDRGTGMNTYGKHLTAFQAAAWKGTLGVLEGWVDRANINKVAHLDGGLTALQAASLSGSLQKVQFLVERGADINSPPAMIGGVTALEAAVRPTRSDLDLAFDSYLGSYSFRPLSDIFRFLLSHGASVNRLDGSDSPLLHDIIECRQADLLMEALNAGAWPNQLWGTRSSSFYRRTPIQLAAEIGDLASITLLMAYGVNLNAPPARHYGRTALQAAASSPNENIEIIKLLLAQGAAIDAPPAPYGGVTALQGAAIQGNINIALLLIENGAAVDAKPALFEGRTAIQGAAEHGRLDMVQLLINAAAALNVLSDRDLDTAMDLARKNGHDDVVELLEAQMQRGCSV